MRATGTLKLIAFPGAPNLPVFVARERGLFAARGIDVELATTPSSVRQAERLLAGECHVAATAFDNVVAYREGQGAVAAPGGECDVFAFMGATRIELSLVTARDVRTHADLRGRSIALDALATGFAFVLYHMLERAGIERADVRMVPVGATPQRWKSVLSGEHAATLTIEPFTSMARAHGFIVLDTSRTALEDYQGGVFAARAGWARAHAETLEAFVAGYLDGLAWTLDPANRDAASRTLRDNMPDMGDAVVDGVMNKLLAPETGLTPHAELSMRGVRTVLELRERYAEPARALGGPERYVDLSYYERAVRGSADPAPA